MMEVVEEVNGSAKIVINHMWWFMETQTKMWN
jgi:hypothetical protein